MSRKKKATQPPVPRAPRTPWQRRRDDALRDAGYTKTDVWRQLKIEGHAYSVSTVRACVDGRFRNAEIEAAFCRLTHCPGSQMFPLDEPPYGREAVERPRMTKGKRAALTRGEQALADAGVRAMSRSVQADD